MTHKETSTSDNPQVIIETSLGSIHLELFIVQAPITVENFLRYTDAKFYDNTLFHRVIDNFMIQGGGFTVDMEHKDNYPPIINEAGNGISNSHGTIAMARTQIVDSATSEFFINLVDNKYLDHSSDTPAGFGYCVFGQVIAGMEVVDQIAKSPTHSFQYFQDVPINNILITSVHRVSE